MAGVRCSRAIRPLESLVESYVIVGSHATNALGVMHGGNLLRLMVDHASASASRVVWSYALLAGIDFVYFASPAREGEAIRVASWALSAGRSSVDVAVRVESLGVPGMDVGSRLVALGHMTFVAVDGSLRPRPHHTCITPKTSLEESQAEKSKALREARRKRLEKRKEEPFDTSPPEPPQGGARAITSKIVNPSDTIAYNVVHAGSMLYLLDELGAVTASKQARGPVVTGFLGPLDFYRPVPVGYVISAHAAALHTGRSTVEVGVKALAGPLGEPWREAVAKGYITYVKLDPAGKPSTIPSDARLEPSREAKARDLERRRIIAMIEGGELDFTPPSQAS